MLRLSIIVPFYNVEPYIEECIRSMYNQDIPFDEYEVICVDDCSPDASRAIVEQLQKEFSNLRLICHKENKKLGGARNTGLKAAKGKYIWFVDSDDYIYPNVLRTLLDTADKNMLDILQFDNTQGEENQTKSIQYSAVNKGETYLFEHLNDWVDKIGGAWKQLFAKDFLYKKQLQFIEDAMYEDTDYLLRAFLMANRVQHVSLYGYHYRINLESITSILVTPVKLAWQVNLVVRCLSAINIAQTSIAKDTISKMVSNILSHLRANIKTFSRADKRVLKKHLVDVDRCKDYVSWRTWLAIKYGITWFI